MKSFFFAIASVLALAACESGTLSNAPVVQSNDDGNRRAEIINDTDISIAKLRVQNAETLTWSGNAPTRRRGRATPQSRARSSR